MSLSTAQLLGTRLYFLPMYVWSTTQILVNDVPISGPCNEAYSTYTNGTNQINHCCIWTYSVESGYQIMRLETIKIQTVKGHMLSTLSILSLGPLPLAAVLLFLTIHVALRIILTIVTGSRRAFAILH